MSDSPRSYFYGCWNGPGHFMFRGNTSRDPQEENRLHYFDDYVHLDSNLAPRHHPRMGLIWCGQFKTREERQRMQYASEEYPQGKFMRHYLSTGFTALQWWDRCQGDSRGNCNSTILLEGRREVSQVLGALEKYFPHVIRNLDSHGVKLEEVPHPVRT